MNAKQLKVKPKAGGMISELVRLLFAFPDLSLTECSLDESPEIATISDNSL